MFEGSTTITEAELQEAAKKFLRIQDDGTVYIGRKMFVVKEVSAEEIHLLRKYHVPSLIIKMDGKLYQSEINPQKPVTYTTKHLCASCKRLLALPYIEGGCDKTFQYSKGIEDHEFVITGYETFGTVKDAYIVCECSYYNSDRR